MAKYTRQLFFFGHRPKRFWNDRNKLSHFSRNVWKYGLKNTVMASFNTTARQMAEMFQRKKQLDSKVILPWRRGIVLLSVCFFYDLYVNGYSVFVVKISKKMPTHWLCWLPELLHLINAVNIGMKNCMEMLWEIILISLRRPSTLREIWCSDHTLKEIVFLGSPCIVTWSFMKARGPLNVTYVEWHLCWGTIWKNTTFDMTNNKR